MTGTKLLPLFKSLQRVKRGWQKPTTVYTYVARREEEESDDACCQTRPAAKAQSEVGSGENRAFSTHCDAIRRQHMHTLRTQAYCNISWYTVPPSRLDQTKVFFELFRVTFVNAVRGFSKRSVGRDMTGIPSLRVRCLTP